MSKPLILSDDVHFVFQSISFQHLNNFSHYVHFVFYFSVLSTLSGLQTEWTLPHGKTYTQQDPVDTIAEVQESEARQGQVSELTAQSYCCHRVCASCARTRRR